MDTTKILDYLENLEKNNCREWYNDNKVKYMQASYEFESLVGALILHIGKYDPSILHLEPKNLTFKLNRDVRYSKDKSPYNPSFRACIGPEGKRPIPVGYYIAVRPHRSFIGGGLFAPMFRDATTRIRDHIVAHGDELASILGNPSFANQFMVKGEALKNLPRDYSLDHPLAELIKNKSWYLEVPISDDLFKQPELFLFEATKTFALMQPFNAFLNDALLGFEMPTK